MTNQNAAGIAARYIATWNEQDSGRRDNMIAALWTDEGTYCDPMMQGAGHTQISALIQAVQERYPAFRFTLVGTPDAVADRLRFSWSFGPDADERVVAGTDFAMLSADGRLHAVTGFIDSMPAAH